MFQKLNLAIVQCLDPRQNLSVLERLGFCFLVTTAHYPLLNARVMTVIQTHSHTGTDRIKIHIGHGSQYRTFVGQYLAFEAAFPKPTRTRIFAIGGTGDMVTGIVTGLLAGGMDLPQAALTAARAARYAGSLAAPTPATQIAEILPFVPQALRKALAQNGSGENGQK